MFLLVKIMEDFNEKIMFKKSVSSEEKIKQTGNNELPHGALTIIMIFRCSLESAYLGIVLHVSIRIWLGLDPS